MAVLAKPGRTGGSIVIVGINEYPLPGFINSISLIGPSILNQNAGSCKVDDLTILLFASYIITSGTLF